MMLAIACSGGSVIAGAVGGILGAGGTWSTVALVGGALGLVSVASASAFPNTVLDEGSDSLNSVLARELERGRRHQREFAVVRIALDGRKDADDVVRRLVREVRRIDSVCVHRSAVYVVASETGRDGADLVLARALATARADASSGAVVVFPHDALTAGDLLARLHRSALREVER